MENSKKIVWYNLAFMAFSTVWGFGNVVNGFAYSDGVAGQAGLRYRGWPVERSSSASGAAEG